jgi:hypothetical protein
MKPRHLLLGAGLAVAAALAAFGDKSAQTEVAEAVERPQAARPAAASAAPAAAAVVEPAAGKGGQAEILRLVPREVLIGDSADQFGASDNDVFGHQDWTPPPPPPPKPAPPPPPPPPTAPPLPFTYIGKSVGEGRFEVYLARGDRTWLVHENDVIDGIYRVDAIAPPTLTLTYLPLNQVQQLNIGVFD